MQSGYLFDHANRIGFSRKQANIKRERSYWYSIYPSTAVYLSTIERGGRGTMLVFVWLQLFSLERHTSKVFSTKLKLVGTLVGSFWSHLCLFVWFFFDRKCIFSDEYLFIYTYACALGVVKERRNGETILNEQTRVLVESVVARMSWCNFKRQTISGNFQTKWRKNTSAHTRHPTEV